MNQIQITFSIVLALVASALWPGTVLGAESVSFTFSCKPDNDVFRSLEAAGAKLERHPSPDEAVSAAAAGSAVLLMADDYPATPLALSSDLFDQAREKNLRLYLEYPAHVPGLKFGASRTAPWERLIVASKALGPDLPHGRLLTAHDCKVLPVEVENPLVVIGRVAGYNHAVYGIPTNAQPILFEMENGRVLVATTRLSGFLSGRFAPGQEWRALWNQILNRLGADATLQSEWTPLVTTMCGPAEKLPSKVERKAFDSAVRWHFDSGLLITEEQSEPLKKLMREGAQLPEDAPLSMETGDGRFGILEGFFSNIRPDGRQTPIVVVRADCQAESAMVLAMDWALNKSQRSRAASRNLLDFLYYKSDLCGDERGNPRHPAYGLIGWGSTAPAWKVANYGDDNARTMLATMLASACLRSSQWVSVETASTCRPLSSTGGSTLTRQRR
jgi:hypothetical protein